MPYVVTRQAYYYQRGLWVEVAAGGLDYSGPDMLVEGYKHLGEGQEYTDPREAVEAAIAIAKAWRKDEHKLVHLTSKGEAWGALGGEGEAVSARQLQRWAEKEYEHLDKCAQCGEVLAKHGRYRLIDYDSDGEFCSESCCDKVYEQICKQEVEEGFRCRECGEPVGQPHSYDGEQTFCSVECVERRYGPSFDASLVKEEGLLADKEVG